MIGCRKLFAIRPVQTIDYHDQENTYSRIVPKLIAIDTLVYDHRNFFLNYCPIKLRQIEYI